MGPRRYRCGRFEVDTTERHFLHDGHELALEPRVFAVIAQLLAKAGTLVARHELLDAVWGHRYVTPSTLNRTITLARRAFGDEAGVPQYIQTVHGAGYRYVGPIVVLDEEPSTPARFGPPPIAVLPARVQDLIGREGEVTQLIRLLADGRAVTVLGPGGMGKTQCALEAARRAAPDFRDGVWFFDLAPLQDAQQWLQVVGAALAVPSTDAAALLEAVRRRLQGRRVLFVLDNCDRVAARAGALVVELLRGIDTLRVLATSQEALNFTGEQLLRLPPLALPAIPASGRLLAADIAGTAAVAMLMSRVHALAPEFELDDDNATAIAAICQRLDGMPLALELAAPRLALLSPEQVLERMDQRFRFLGSDAAGRDPRHRSLVRLLEWSFGLLSAHEQRLLEWCSVFVQSWTVDAALGMAGALGHEPEAAIDLLAGLVNRSLVSVVPGATPPRYRQLETVREFARSRLGGKGEEGRARAAHLAAVRSMCHAASEQLRGPRMRECIEQLVQEHGNIAAALDTARAGDDEQAAMDILGALSLYFKAHGAYTLCAQWCRDVLPGGAAAETPERARALLTWGVLQVHAHAEAQELVNPLPEAARIAALHQDWWCEGYAHGYYALHLANWGRGAAAEPHAKRVAALAHQHGDALLTGLAGLAQGWISLSRGEPEAALLELNRVGELGADLHQRHFIKVYTGLAHFALGDLAGAAQAWLEGMRLGAAVTNIRGIAGSIEGGAYLASRAQDWTTAARLLAAAALIREQTNVPLFRFWLPHHESALAALRAALPEAERARAWEAGRVMRQEEAAQEAQVILWRMSGNTERRAAQRGLNLPSGS